MKFVTEEQKMREVTTKIIFLKNFHIYILAYFYRLVQSCDSTLETLQFCFCSTGESGGRTTRIKLPTHLKNWMTKRNIKSLMILSTENFQFIKLRIYFRISRSVSSIDRPMSESLSEIKSISFESRELNEYFIIHTKWIATTHTYGFVDSFYRVEETKSSRIRSKISISRIYGVGSSSRDSRLWGRFCTINNSISLFFFS